MFYSKYGVDVHGFDLSTMMIDKANQYRQNMDEKVQERLVFE